jgi:hypothetical protein
MTDASIFHRSSTALVVCRACRMTSLLKVVHSSPLAPRPTAHGRSKIVLAGWITIRGGALGSDHDRRAGRGTGTDEEHYPERRPQPPPPARPAARAQSAPPA